MKIYGNGFTMISSADYDLIQMINEVELERTNSKEAQIKARKNAKRTFLIGATAIAIQVIIGNLLKKTNSN